MAVHECFVVESTLLRPYSIEEWPDPPLPGLFGAGHVIVHPANQDTERAGANLERRIAQYPAYVGFTEWSA